MRKFLLPIINLVNLILISIVWGLSGQSAVLDKAETGKGNFYQVVWMGTKANVLGIVAFFLFCFACLAMLIAFLPLKQRKIVTCLGGAMFVAAGVLFFIAPFPPHYDCGINEPQLSGALIAMGVLTLVAGAFMLCMSALEFLKKNDSGKSSVDEFIERTSQELKSNKFGLFYLLGSLGTIIFSIIVIVLVASTFRPALILVYLGITLVFFVTLFVLELRKGKRATK